MECGNDTVPRPALYIARWVNCLHYVCLYAGWAMHSPVWQIWHSRAVYGLVDAFDPCREPRSCPVVDWVCAALISWRWSSRWPGACRLWEEPWTSSLGFRSWRRDVMSIECNQQALIRQHHNQVFGFPTGIPLLTILSYPIHVTCSSSRVAFLIQKPRPILLNLLSKHGTS